MLRKLTLLLTIGLLFGGCKTNTASGPPSNSTATAVEKDISASPVPNQPAQAPPSSQLTAVKPRLDACALLTPQEIEAVQGEPVKDSKLSGQATGGFNVSQCFFTLPTFTNSISLMVAHKGDGAGAREPKEFWRATFHDAPDSRKEKDKDEEKEESRPAQKVSGLGDEAFWIGNQVAGALYVLKGDAYVRVSIGGPSNRASRQRSRVLAQKAIARL